jgi:hypothetical protein
MKSTVCALHGSKTTSSNARFQVPFPGDGAPTDAALPSSSADSKYAITDRYK